MLRVYVKLKKKLYQILKIHLANLESDHEHVTLWFTLPSPLNTHPFCWACQYKGVRMGSPLFLFLIFKNIHAACCCSLFIPLSHVNSNQMTMFLLDLGRAGGGLLMEPPGNE